MKITLLFIILFSLHFNAVSQVLEPVEVDSAAVKLLVRQEFHKMFKEISSTKWYTVGGLSYEVHFQMDGKYYEALYRRDGVLSQLQVLIKEKEVPKKIIKQITEYHIGFKLEKIYLEIRDGVPCYYVFYLENEDEKRVDKVEISR